MRDYLRTLLDYIPKQKHGLRVKHIDLFDFVMDYLKSRKLLDKAIQMQRDKGDESLKKALAGLLHESKLSAVFAEVAKPEQHDLVIVSGVGSVWPLLRSQTLLNNLHPLRPTEIPPWYLQRLRLRSMRGLRRSWLSRCFLLSSSRLPPIGACGPIQNFVWGESRYSFIIVDRLGLPE